MEFRRTLTCIVVALTCIFAGFAVSPPNQETSCTYTHSTDKPALGSSTQGEDSTTNDPDNSNCDPPKLYAAFKRPEWVQVIVALVGIGVIAWQGWLTRRAAEATEIAAKAAKDNIELLISKERARLVVDLEDLDLSPQDGIYAVRFKIRILGTTPAFIVGTACAAYVVPEKFVADQETLDRGMVPIYSVPSVIPTNSEPIERLAIFLLVGEEESEIEEVKNSRLFVGIRGIIVYNDVFDRERKTPFRYVSRESPIAGIVGEWIKCGGSEENKTT